MQHVFFVFLFPAIAIIDWCNFIWILDYVILQEQFLIFPKFPNIQCIFPSWTKWPTYLKSSSLLTCQIKFTWIDFVYYCTCTYVLHHCI